MKKTKILHVLNVVGGVKVYMDLLLNNLDLNLFQICIVQGKDDKEDYSDKNLKNYKISLIRNISFFKDSKAIFDLVKIIKKEKPDLIHCHSAKAGVVGRVAAYITGTKILYTPHAFSYLSSKNKIKRIIFLTIERCLANKKSILLATSLSEKSRAINDVFYNPKNTLVFENSISEIKIIKALSIPKTWPDKYICTVGRPSYQKNIEAMIDVIYEIKKKQTIHLVLVGVGYYSPDLENVKNKIKTLKLEDEITLLNWTSREDVLHIISKSQLYFSTARYEGLPYSVIESLALSKPCVVSDCDGNRDLIIDGNNGFVIKNNNSILFSEKIINLLNDSNLLETFSNNALQSFNENYNINLNISGLEDIYLKYAKN